MPPHAAPVAEPSRPGLSPDRHAAPDATLGLTFPTGFVWGAATSAYQIEGATSEDGRGDSVWDAFCREPGKVRDDDTADVAADHYHRFPEDLDIIEEPGPGQLPVLHRLAPRHAERQRDRSTSAGWTSTSDWSTDCTSAASRRWPRCSTGTCPSRCRTRAAGSRATPPTGSPTTPPSSSTSSGELVPNWLTINEPKTVVQNGYLMGIHAPGLIDPDAAYGVAHHLALGHGLAVQSFRATGCSTRIGPALNLHPTYAGRRQRGRPGGGHSATTGTRTGSTSTRCSAAATPAT